MSKSAQRKTTADKSNAKTVVRDGRTREASRIVGAVPKTAKLSTKQAAIWDDRNKLDKAHNRLYG